MNFTNLFLAELWTTIKTHILDNLHIFRGLRLQIFRNLPKNVAVFRQNPPFSAIFHNWDHIMCSPLKIISESDKFSPFFFTDPEKLVWDGKFRNRWNLCGWPLISAQVAKGHDQLKKNYRHSPPTEMTLRLRISKFNCLVPYNRIYATWISILIIFYIFFIHWFLESLLKFLSFVMPCFF